MKEEFWHSPRFLTFITISLLISFSTVPLLPSVQADSNDDFSSATSLQSGVFVDGVVNQPHGTDSYDYYRVNVLTGDSIVFELFSEDYVDICIYEGTQSSDQVECYYYIDLLITHYEFTQQSTYYLEVSCLECEWGGVAGEYVVTATVYSDEAGNSINDAADLEPETMVNGSLFGTDSDYYSTPVVDGDTIQVTIDSESGHTTSYRIYDDDEVMIQEDHELGDYDFNITVVTEGNLTIELLCAFEEQCDYSLIARGTSYVPDSDGDGVDDNSDLCPGHDDNIDVDNDGIPDGCDSLLDNDGDGVANSADACEGHDDNVDIDNDGTPDGCDSLLDNDGDGVANSADACEGHDDDIDVDEDGTPDGCDSLIDNDGDGIEDASDNCPNTPSGVTTNSSGCPDSMANMELDLTANTDTIDVGGEIELRLYVANHGPAIANNVTISGELPTQLTLVSTSGCENDPEGFPTCILGNIDVGKEKIITVNVTVNENVTEPLNYSLYLIVDGATIIDFLGNATLQLNVTTNENTSNGSEIEQCDDCPATPLSCGDGIIQAGEVCDDGNIIDGDGCSSSCLLDDLDSVSDDSDDTPVSDIILIPLIILIILAIISIPMYSKYSKAFFYKKKPNLKRRPREHVPFLYPSNPKDIAMLSDDEKGIIKEANEQKKKVIDRDKELEKADGVLAAAIKEENTDCLKAEELAKKAFNDANKAAAAGKSADEADKAVTEKQKEFDKLDEDIRTAERRRDGYSRTVEAIFNLANKYRDRGDSEGADRIESNAKTNADRSKEYGNKAKELKNSRNTKDPEKEPLVDAAKKARDHANELQKNANAAAEEAKKALEKCKKLSEIYNAALEKQQIALEEAKSARHTLEWQAEKANKVTEKARKKREEEKKRQEEEAEKKRQKTLLQAEVKKQMKNTNIRSCDLYSNNQKIEDLTPNDVTRMIWQQQGITASDLSGGIGVARAGAIKAYEAKAGEEGLVTIGKLMFEMSWDMVKQIIPPGIRDIIDKVEEELEDYQDLKDFVTKMKDGNMCHQKDMWEPEWGTVITETTYNKKTGQFICTTVIMFYDPKSYTKHAGGFLPTVDKKMTNKVYVTTHYGTVY